MLFVCLFSPQFMKDAMGAMHDFQAAIKADPSYSLAYFNAANIYFKNRQFRQVCNDSAMVPICTSMFKKGKVFQYQENFMSITYKGMSLHRAVTK